MKPQDKAPKKKFLSRLKRGIVSLIEIIGFVFLLGLTVGGFALGFVSAYQAFGYQLFLYTFLFFGGFFLVVYYLGLADEWDEIRTTSNDDKKD